MRVVVHDACGPPGEVLRIEPRPLPRPRDREVVVALEASPIHPTDLAAIRGAGPTRPRLPGATPGQEGLGRVIDVGAEVEGLRRGTRVLLPMRSGAWADRVVLSPSAVTPVPDDGDATQLAMARLNPTTAALLLRAIVAVRPGEWVLQNAANGAVGQLVCAWARRAGIRTLNVVRRPEAERAVRAAGGDVVLVDRGRPLADEIRAYTGGATLRLALDGVGGEAVRPLVDSLSHGGTLVTYGATSGDWLRLDPSALAARDLRVRGFWLAEWMRTADPATREALQHEVHEAVVSGALTVPVAATYGLGNIELAVAHAARDHRDGKVLLTGEAWTG